MQTGLEMLDANPNQKQILLRQISATVRPSRTKAIVSDVRRDEGRDLDRQEGARTPPTEKGRGSAMSRCTKRNAPG